jgi:hypothetical protein
MLQEQHISHAEHNLDAASFIVKNSIFFDWTITVSFYSAIHYVESVLIYLSSQNAKLKYFDELVKVEHSEQLKGKYISNNGKPLYNPHPIRKKLVEENFSRIRDSYNRLEDASWTQRYCNWQQYDKTKCENMIEKHLYKIKKWHDETVKIENKIICT